MTARILIAAGVALVALGATLLALRSFSYPFFLSLGMFLVAAGLLRRAIADPLLAAAAVLVLSGFYLVVFATVATPVALLAMGPATLAAAALIAYFVRGRASR